LEKEAMTTLSPVANSLRRSLRLVWVVLLVGALALPLPVRLAQAEVAPLAAAGRRVIVRLHGEPLARQGRALAARDALLAQQTQTTQALRQALPAAQVERSYQVAFNGLAVRLPDGAASTLARLRALPGVAAVYEEAVFRPTLYASLPALNVPALWQTLGGDSMAGAGVKIAVLDSGIDIAHPMFDATSFSYPPDYPKGDPRATNAKVIAARTYYRPGAEPLPGEETPTPGQFGSGHGTHLAGIAAGNRVVAQWRGLAQEISGVAPRSWLMNYRLFYPYDNSRVEEAYTAEILQAIEDAVSDGADVLCLGWANETPRPALGAPEALALEAAIAAGGVVVAPAGNDGPAYGSASRIPGGMERVISVGSVSKERAVAYDVVDVTSPTPVNTALQAMPFARALFGGALAAPLAALPYEAVSRVAPESNALACAALPSQALQGKVALIARGECTFADKAYWAQQAGALAVIISNTADIAETMQCGGDHCGGEVRIPVVMVASSTGAKLLAWLQEHPVATLRLDPRGRIVANTPNVVATSSGRGPAFMRLLKPDVVAPDVNVLSASHDGQAAGVTYAQLSGTSIAAAHVAGVAALLRQAHPEWGHDAIKAALIGTARGDVLTLGEAAGTMASPLQRGGGLVDANAAAFAGLLVSPPSVSLPTVAAGTTVSFTLQLQNPESVARVFSTTVTVSPGVALTLPPQVTLAPRQTITVVGELVLPARMTLTDVEGTLTFQSGSLRVRVPFWAHVPPPLLAVDVLLLDNDGSAVAYYPDYAPAIGAALTEAGLSYQLWDADARFGQAQTIPPLGELQKYGVVLWFTGDNEHPDGYYVPSTALTAVDMQLLAAYLDGGGRLLAMGQNLARVSNAGASGEPQWDDRGLYHNYLGAHWVQDDVYALAGSLPLEAPEVIGLPGTFMEGVLLDLGSSGDGARNQDSVDEIALGGRRDGADRAWVQALLVAQHGRPQQQGYVGVAKSAEPTLEAMHPVLPYRTLYLSFGLEGVNNNERRTARVALLQRGLDWLRDTLTVTLPALTTAANEPLRISCAVSSTHGLERLSYRWDLGNGAGIASTTQPSVLAAYDRRGAYPIAVEVTDALGHKAVAQGVVHVVDGADSTLTVNRTQALVGETLVYEVTGRHSGPRTVPFSLTMPLPAGLLFLSSSGGSYGQGVLRWSGALRAGESFSAELRAQIPLTASLGQRYVATAQFAAGEDRFVRSVTSEVVKAFWLPLIKK
jgi:subtilisin family serine protease